MRYVSVAVIALALCSRAEAQIIRPAPRAPQPIGWASFSLGIWRPQAVNDGTTKSVWNFSDAVQYRVSLEKPLQSQATIGITATLARASLSYETGAGSEAGAACPSTCDADANISQLLASFHAGGGGFGIGLHQVIELGLGATMYSNFRSRSGGERLPPSSPDIDLALAIGYGLGYSLSPTMQLNLVQDLALVLHQRTGLAGGTSATSQQYTTRIGLRVGLGSK